MKKIKEKSKIFLAIFMLLLTQWLTNIVLFLIASYFSVKNNLLPFISEEWQVFVVLSLSLTLGVLLLFLFTPLLEKSIKHWFEIDHQTSISTENIADYLITFVGGVTIMAIAGEVEVDTGSIGINIAIPVFCSTAIVLYYKIKKQLPLLVQSIDSN